MDREVYVAEEDLYLVDLSERDRDKYMELLKQTSGIDGFYDNLVHENIMWEIAFDSWERNYSIYDENEDYCGNVVLKHPDDKTPEIGIDLIKSKRNKGIAAKCIKLLARKTYEERKDIAYFVLRVSSENPHSRHMIEKMGAVYAGEDETLMKRVMKAMKNNLDEESYKKAQDNLKELFEEYPDTENEVIYRYKLVPDKFL